MTEIRYVNKIEYKTVFWSKWCIPLILLLIILIVRVWYANSEIYPTIQEQRYNKEYQEWEVDYSKQNEIITQDQISLENCNESFFRQECDFEKNQLELAKDKLKTIELEKPIEY